METWDQIDLDEAVAVLASWLGRAVVVSVELPAGAPDLAGMAGRLRSAGDDGRSFAFELEGPDAWFRVPRNACFRGATHVPAAGLLVLHFAGEDPDAAPGVLVDVQLCHDARPQPARWQ